MRIAVAAAALLTGTFVPSAASAPPKPITPIIIQPIGTATAVAAPRRAGARPAQLTVALRTMLQCGRPRPGAIVVSLPTALHVPARIAADAVRINGGAPAAITVSGHTVGMNVKPAAGLLCDVIGPGTITVLFTRAAGLGNPPRAGRYPVTLVASGHSGRATLIVS